MKTLNPLIWIGLVFFFIQYYIVLAILFLSNWLRSKAQIWMKGHSKIVVSPLQNTHPDVFVTKEQLIRLDGFEFSTFEIQTDDNYYISLWRIRSTSPTDHTHPYPILILHGLLDCSISWFFHQQKHKCLPFILASKGYDVWLGNNRGTKFSMRNENVKDYWNFSFDHFIEYDQPKMIDSVLQKTNASKLIYIGHSQGSTQFLASTGLYPELRKKIHCFIGMGTVISLDGIQNHTVLKYVDRFKGVEFLKLAGFKTILALPDYLSKATGVLICNTKAYLSFFFGVVNMLCGTPKKNKINLDRLGVIIAHQPGGASIPNVLHWIQIYRYGKLRKYDYGKKKNMVKYGCQIPPEYDFSHLGSLPFNTYIFRGTKDAVICDKNLSQLNSLFNPEKYKVYELEDYAHLDYVWGVDASEHIYYPIQDIVAQETIKCDKS